MRRHSPRVRFRRRSESNASGAACVQRPYVSHHEVPGFNNNVIAGTPSRGSHDWQTLQQSISVIEQFAAFSGVRHYDRMRRVRDRECRRDRGEAAVE